MKYVKLELLYLPMVPDHLAGLLCQDFLEHPGIIYILLGVLMYSIAAYIYELCRVFTSHKQRLQIYSDATHENI